MNPIRHSVIRALLPGLLLGLSGCASAPVTANREKFTVLSDPLGAHVQLSNGATGTTPAHFEIPSESDLTVTMSKAGYGTVVIPLHPSRRINRAGAALEVSATTMTFPWLAPVLLPIGLAAIVSGEAPVARHRPNPLRVKLSPLPAAGHGLTQSKATGPL